MKRRNYLVSSGALILTGCTAVGPDYMVPEIPLPTHFVGAQNHERPAAVAWWTELQDKRLDDLVARGLEQNLSIKIAFQRVQEARAQLAATGVAELVSGSLTAERTVTGGSKVATMTTNSASTIATFIFDIFGRARRDREQASANLEAQRFDAATVRLTFLSSLVGSYIDARYYQDALALTRRNIASRRQTFDLVRNLERIGAASRLDTAQAQAQLDLALALLPPLEAKFNAAVFAIATLLAEPAGPLLASMTDDAPPQPHPCCRSGLGTPADLLRYRPDLRAAERRYAAAVAAAGVAEADMFPSITLSGTITASTTNTWFFGPALNLPLLNQPVLAANRRAAVEAAKRAELEWRQKVLTAVGEVQSEQSRLAKFHSQASTLRNAAQLSGEARDLYRKNYELGSASLLDFLIAERTFLDTELSAAQAVRDAVASWAKLQVATGRGWADAAGD